MVIRTIAFTVTEMYDVVRKQRISRLERGLGEEPSRTFQLRRFEGIPQYTGVLQPLSSFSQRDEDDITVTRRRSPSPPQGCRYSLMFLVIAMIVFVVICIQFTHDIPTRLTSRLLQQTEQSVVVSTDKGCPVCPVCTTNST